MILHGALQGIKPITNGIKIAEAFGVKDKIDKALESNPIGRGIKSVGRFLQGALGYGSKRMKGMGRKRRVGRPRIHRGGSKTMYQRRIKHRKRMGRGLKIV